jgi:hypothetical protein
MLTVDEYVQIYVARPSQLQAYKIALELWDMLVALEKKGYVREELRGKRTFERRELLVTIASNADGIIASMNKFYGFFFQKEKNRKFVEMMRKNGLNDEDLFHVLNVQLVFDFLLESESFKNIVQLILQNISPKSPLGYLFDTLENATKKNGEAKRIADRIDIDLRNGLAHFSFREENQEIFYYKYEKKEGCWILKESHIESAKLLQKTREVSLMRALMGSIIPDWYVLPVKGKI